MKQCCACGESKTEAGFDVDRRTGKPTGRCVTCRRRAQRIRQRARTGIIGVDPDVLLPKRRPYLLDGHTKLSPQGYVLEMRRGHPRANAAGYVYQHILAAEQRYGFPVTREFTVHHRNRDKADNNPANLDLRVGNHGPGGDLLDVLLRLPDLRLRAAEILASYARGERVARSGYVIPVASGL